MTERKNRRGWIVAGSIAGVVVLLAGALAYAQVGRWHHRGPMDAEALADRIEHGVKYVLSEVDASAEQKAQVTSILQAAAKDVHVLADQHHAAHKQLHEILAAETIDRARLETLRADQVRLADEASKRIVAGFADAAEVLTPQQRAALVAEMEKHHGHWHGAGH